MAKVWMAATAKYAATPAIASEPAKSVGGPASCVASLTTAMQEGGNQAGAAATYPYKNANPFGIYGWCWQRAGPAPAFGAPRAAAHATT
jgi:hypothetical protein